MGLGDKSTLERLWSSLKVNKHIVSEVTGNVLEACELKVCGLMSFSATPVVSRSGVPGPGEEMLTSIQQGEE